MHYYFCDYKLGTLIHLLGGFPKYLFAPDVSAIKNTMRIIRKEKAVSIAPEGRLSASGTLESFHFSTAKLIKKLAVDVIFNHINGAYLTYPKWAKDIRRGRVEVEFKHLFKAEEIPLLSEEEINERIAQVIQYDDFAWQEDKQISYRSKKRAEGLEYILIRCPKCHNLYTIQTKKDKLWCTSCHLEAQLDEKYQFISHEQLPNIRDWYLYQKEYESKNIPNDYILKSKVILKLPSNVGKGFIQVGEGYSLLSQNELRYQGLMNKKIVDIRMSLKQLQVILFGANEDFEVYYNNTLYYFVPENIKECVRYTILAEVFYRRLVNE